MHAYIHRAGAASPILPYTDLLCVGDEMRGLSSLLLLLVALLLLAEVRHENRSLVFLRSSLTSLPKREAACTGAIASFDGVASRQRVQLLRSLHDRRAAPSAGVHSGSIAGIEAADDACGVQIGAMHLLHALMGPLVGSDGLHALPMRFACLHACGQALEAGSPTLPKAKRFASLLQPLDADAKALLPNCSACRGCNIELSDMSGEEVTFENGIRFKHGKGATNTRLFFARVPGSPDRSIVKVSRLGQRGKSRRQRVLQGKTLGLDR
jgi:hypothetical protein